VKHGPSPKRLALPRIHPTVTRFALSAPAHQQHNLAKVSPTKLTQFTSLSSYQTMLDGPSTLPLRPNCCLDPWLRRVHGRDEAAQSLLTECSRGAARLLRPALENDAAPWPVTRSDAVMAHYSGSESLASAAHERALDRVDRLP
jgi:hypothetical protein